LHPCANAAQHNLMNTPLPTPLPLASRWHICLLAASLVSIALHFVLSTVSLHAVANIAGADIPLLAVIIIGGIPLLIQITSKLFNGSVGADFLGAIELVAAALLDQYLAAILIIIMLSGGQALEAYAMRKASSVLRALSDRMPSKAHRKNGTKVEEVTLADIAIGDEIVVFPHETAPVDCQAPIDWSSLRVSVWH